MRIAIYSLLGLLIWTDKSLAQDTTYLDSKTEYFTKNGDSYEKLRTLKIFPKYSREKIQTSRDSFKIEYCYYFDKQRHVSNYTKYYSIICDSILTDNGIKWYFKKLSENNICVEKHDSCFTERGIVYSIIPFIKNGKFINLNEQNDTILIEHFEMDKYVSTSIPKTVFKDSIYTIVDELPKFPSKYGDLKNYISKHLTFPEVFAESCIQGKVYVKTVITSKGEIKNIEILRGVDPLLDNEALKVISRLPEFEPAKLNGKAVNVYFIIPVKFILQ